MSNLNLSDKTQLRRAGFTISEIRTLDTAVDKASKPQPVDIHSPAWQSAINRRKVFSDRARQVYTKTHRQSLSRKRFDNIINQYFKGDIFSWLKLSYHPGKKTDFMEAVKRRLQYKQQNMQRGFTR